jgi:hypothetical protein
MQGTPEDGQYRPLIPVTIELNGGHPEVLNALVDSGCDLTTISTDMAEAMTGLPFDQIGQDAGFAVGVGRKPQRWIAGRGLYLGRVFATRILICDIPRVAILGRQDFMRTFDVRFYWGHHPPEFSVEPTQPRRVARPQPPTNPTIRPKKHR